MRARPRSLTETKWLLVAGLRGTGPPVQFQHVRVTMSLEFTRPPIGGPSIGHLRDGRLTA